MQLRAARILKDRTASWPFLAVSIVLLLLIHPAFGRAATIDDDSGACGLAGFAAVGEVQGFGLELLFGYHWSHMFAGGRMLMAQEFMLDLWGTGETPRGLFEIGPVGGLRYGWRFVQAQIYTGVSFVRGEWYDDSAYVSKQAIGVPVGACVLLAPTREIGIGIGAFWNFNGVKSFAGGSMVFTLWR